MGMEMIGFPCPFCIDFSAGGMNMDSMDRSILKCLSENSRQSATEISQTVHLSVAAVIEANPKTGAEWNHQTVYSCCRSA